MGGLNVLQNSSKTKGGWPLGRRRALQTEVRGCRSKKVFKDRAG